MNTRRNVLKAILWALVGILAAVSVARFARGLGAVTNLSHGTPWGLWNAVKISIVPFSAGGFVVAAVFYIFHMERFRPLLRLAILTGFLGYASFATLLLYDLGVPYRIWHAIIFWQHHSVLFEVAWCVMLYLTVLALEFAPVVLEHPLFSHPVFGKTLQILKKATIPLVVAGIVLSTLHQSSLGSLFLITPSRLHPLWYSSIIWILFFVSAVAMGLMAVTVESFFSAWFFGHKLRMDLLSQMGKAASIVLFVYAGLRLGDLVVREDIGLAFQGNWQALLFLFELSVSALIPATLLLFRRVRTSPAGLATCAGMTVLGMIGYRFNVCIVAFWRPEAMPYFPTWMEVAVSLGIVAGAMLVFLFFVERLKVYPEEQSPGPDAAPGDASRTDYSPVGMRGLMPDSLSAPRRYSLAVVAGAAAAVAFLPADLLSGRQMSRTPVSAARTWDGSIQARAGQAGHDGWTGHDLSLLESKDATPPGARALPLLLIDGNRDERFVLFPHDDHVERLVEIEGLRKQDTCATCHHLNMPLDTNTSCCECHRDMYADTDVFDHAFHVSKRWGNDGCADCHDATETKSRDTALGCGECHQHMIAEHSSVVPRPPAEWGEGFAPGYMNAMHDLCRTCHEEKVKEDSANYGRDFAECANCHREVDTLRFQQMRPRVIDRVERPPSRGRATGMETVVSR